MISLKSSRWWIVPAVALILSASTALSPAMPVVSAQPLGKPEAADAAAKKDALAAMQTWLGQIDVGNYANSWSQSAKSFQKAINSEQWQTALKGVRTPLGKSLQRQLASAAYQTVPPKGAITTTSYFVIAQFDSSFENLKYARETVTFEKETDGKWRAAGYYIKPQ